jgi:glycerate 2-kinase
MNRAAIERAFARALRELSPARCVAEALPRSLLRSTVPIRIVAIGKAAPAMAAGALRRLGSAVERCLVVTTDGTDVAALEAVTAKSGIADRVEVMHAAHPLPDARSVRAGEACLAMVDDRAQLLVLVSGGASALACVPSAEISLSTKRAITHAMLDSGASIQDINVVRKHLSRIKGGGLARGVDPRRLVTLVASDVIGGTASDVGSGPSVPDDTTVREARRLLKRFAPAFEAVPLVPTFVPRSGARGQVHVVLSPEQLARTMAALLRDALARERGRARAPQGRWKIGTVVTLLPPSQAPVEELAAEYVTLLERTRAPRIIVRAAEPVVEVGKTAGRGGRSTHLAALVGALLSARRAPGAKRILFAALASDGVDGSSGTAGAVIDGRFGERAAARLGESALARSLERFDTGTLHRALGTAVLARATGHNLADIHVLVVA